MEHRLGERGREALMTVNLTAVCGHCRQRVAARHEVRDGKVFLVKQCPRCGGSEALVSTDAAAWQHKRDIWGYDPTEPTGCSLHCDTCRIDHTPTIVFVEVTNRCNMSCPICIATVQSVGFDYHPPLEYFAKLFVQLGRLKPKPFVELYGGEPTLREDLVEIVRLARRQGLRPRVVTNAIRLADEDYCRSLCEAKVPLRISYDGPDPETYQRLRGDPHVGELKRRALANLRKYNPRKHAMLCCLGLKVNDKHVGDILATCHEYRDVIEQVGFIPLKEDWQGDGVQPPHHTTQEDAERAIREGVVDGRVDFIPAGFVHWLAPSRRFFTENPRSKNFMFSGSHPNCESVTFLVSDGTNYRSINHYLKMPLDRLAEEVFRRARVLNDRLARLDPHKFLQRWRGRWLVARTFVPLMCRAADLRAVFRGHPFRAAARILAGAVRGERIWDALRRVTGLPSLLRVGTLPFEEYLTVESQRLAKCRGVFAYEDARDGSLQSIPVCTWFLYRKEVLRTISEKYGVARSTRETSPSPAAPSEHRPQA